MTEIPSRWLKSESTESPTKLRLFCFPFAGAGTSAYMGWRKHLAPEVELISVQLPGRENRYSEPAISDMPELLQALETVIAPYTNQPWAVFGHSMGAAIGYNIVGKLVSQGYPKPAKLFVSAKTPPHMPPNKELISELSDQMLIKALSQRYGADISNGHKELLELMLPTLRADFKLIETTFDYPTNSSPLPITAFNGSLDHSVSAQQMNEWCQYSNNEFKQIEINGPHFYLQSAMLELIQHINQQLVPLN